jgi:nucleotide-binding universal stress UspA family protein
MTIVVGIDGSNYSHDALRWAVSEARMRGTSLTLVHSWEMPVIDGKPPYEIPKEPLAERSEHVIRDALAAVPEHEGLEINRQIAESLPARALIDASQNAQLVVVGSRGLGGFKGLLLGSVAQQVADHSACPVVIVRPHH